MSIEVGCSSLANRVILPGYGCGRYSHIARRFPLNTSKIRAGGVEAQVGRDHAGADRPLVKVLQVLLRRHLAELVQRHVVAAGEQAP